MAHVLQPNLRGKGISKTKFTKAGEPKRAGNWSALTIYHQSLQTKDYYVRLVESKETPGIKILIVGDHTPLFKIMGDLVEQAAIHDEHFYSYRQEGEYKAIGNGKAYKSAYTLRKNPMAARKWTIDPHAFILRCEIYTEGDFAFNFPEY